MVKKKKRRIARSPPILEEVDLIILQLLLPPKNIKPPVLVDLDTIKKKANLSHNSLLVHLRRLHKYNLIQVLRSLENYKLKLVMITNNGFRIWKYFHNPNKP